MTNKSISLLFLLLIFSFFCLTQFSFAQKDQKDQTTVGDALKYVKLNRTFDILFGLKSDQPLEVGIIWLVLFIMFAAVFSDIFGTFIAVSKTTAYIMGIGFAFIIASTRALFKFSIAIFGAIGYVGVLSVAIVILTALAAFVFIHIAIGKWAVRWATKRQIAIEAIKKAKQPAKAWKALQEFEEMALKK